MIISFEFGIQTLEFKTWEEYVEHINSNLKYRKFVWRGQADSSWDLEPTLDRSLREAGEISDTRKINEHLKRFKFASRGRRGNNPPELKSDNDWWALGQHNGLHTPLLDWTKSPFVSAFFAFESSVKSRTDHRVVFGIAQTDIENKSRAINKTHKSSSRPPIIEFIEPLSNENARLVSQGGLFTRNPPGVDVESWMRKNYTKEEKYIRAWKLLIPEYEREKILQSLNRMNINYSSLFPDLFGASEFVNMDLKINDY